MQEVAARAALVSAADVGEGLTTSVPRAEVEQALRSEEGPLELILDVTRFAAGEAAETGNLAVVWERGDVERLLSQSVGDRVTLTFDGETLREAMDADVEAHGLRQKALVLAVAVTAAAGTAGGAAAHPVLGEGTGGNVVMVGDGAGGQAVQPEGGSTGQAVQPEGGSTGQAVQPGDGSTGASRDDGFEVSSPSSAEAVGIGGAMALAITGAAFVVGRRRSRPT
ncbi:MAG: hypothetical protein M3229_04505 [Actinomycetota bacterium]|nr:hypothetical protein [Actinomycetota bacterium]